MIENQKIILRLVHIPEFQKWFTSFCWVQKSEQMSNVTYQCRLVMIDLVIHTRNFSVRDWWSITIQSVQCHNTDVPTWSHYFRIQNNGSSKSELAIDSTRIGQILWRMFDIPIPKIPIPVYFIPIIYNELSHVF